VCITPAAALALLLKQLCLGGVCENNESVVNAVGKSNVATTETVLLLAA
jgi:hypothetical protein